MLEQKVVCQLTAEVRVHGPDDGYDRPTPIGQVNNNSRLHADTCYLAVYCPVISQKEEIQVRRACRNRCS
jgi:hypothetical protein